MSPIEYLNSSKTAKVLLVVLVVLTAISLSSHVYAIASAWQFMSF